MIIDVRQPSEMVAAHRRASRPRPSAGGPRPSARARNVEPILAIGNTEFVHFRGRAYGVPPLPWKAGEKLNDAHVAAIEAMEILKDNAKDRDAIADYYRAIGKMPAILWRNCRPTGKFRRLLHRLRLLRNVFDDASDGELLEYSDFFLARRMRSGVRPPQPAATQARRTS